MKTYDEAEREAHYEQSFKILFQLNQFVLPALYVFIFVISLSLREIQYLHCNCGIYPSLHQCSKYFYDKEIL